METRIERSITYTYGPAGMGTPFRGVVSGFYTFEELLAQIRDERWGSSFTVVEKKERTVTPGGTGTFTRVK